MGDNLHDCLKIKGSLLSSHHYSFLSVAPDYRSCAYPFSLHGMKSEDGIRVCDGISVFVCGRPKLTN